jgi:hypothetical protein
MIGDTQQKYHSDLERLVANSLALHGVQAVTQFRVRSAGGFNVELDLYITSPQRAFVEIKSGHINFERTRKFMDAAYGAFEGQVVPFLVVVGSRGKRVDDYFADSAVEVIEVEDSSSIQQVASIISSRLYSSGSSADVLALLKPEDLSDRLDDTGPLADVLINFRTRINPDDFDVLRMEAREFVKEYTSGHYTTAVLCVGRTLEFVIYTLAKSWGVPINKRTIKLLDDLEGNFNSLCKVVIDYAYADNADQKSMLRSTVKKSMADFSRRINEATSDVYFDHDPIETEYPVNIQSILRDVKKKHSQITVVRQELEKISQQGMTTELLAMRNRAAHANTTGKRIDFSKQDVEKLIEILRSLFFSLGTVADAIAKAPPPK